MENDQFGVRLDPRITLAVIATVFVQMGGAFLWAGGQSARLHAVETRIESHTLSGERLARLETQMDQARASLARIEDRLDRRD
jgi:hypothetical protein